CYQHVEAKTIMSLQMINPDRLKTAKTLVDKAVKLRKVFSVQGPYPVIRAALWARGWVERRLPHPVQRSPTYPCVEEGDGNDGAEEGEKGENLDDMYDLMSRLVRNETTYFYWTTRRDNIDCRSLRHDQMTNHYANAGTFTTKVGLCVNLRNLQWFDTADPDTFFPRCYRLGAEDEKHAFIEDFRRTACTSLLQYVVETKLDNEEHRSVGPEIINTALHVCQEFLSVLKHSNIDVTAEIPPSVEEAQWAEFLKHYYMVVHKGKLIRGSSVFVERCQDMLTRLQAVCPQLDTDGLNNIWIIKPGAKSRGRGIMCMNHLDEILALVDTDRALTKESKWVVQKYLERPLLVHCTKFDLRQWFLVTDWNPLTIWFYKECYLRFSTQPYSTKTLDSSVHLCNNSIQKHFQPSRNRHPGLPEDNMWSCSQFRSFLQREGRETEWESVVIPGMQQAVVHALQTAQDLVEPHKASFELYGADFMLGRDLRPWLLEINASPTMACSSTVTARLCPAVQVDTLRVVLDWRTDPSAYTGGFKLIYKQAAVEVPQYLGVNLLVEGATIKRSRHYRQSFISNSPLPHQVHPEQLSQSQVKKSQMTSTCPKREHDRKAERQNTCPVRKSCRSVACEQPASVHTEPQKKAQRLGLRRRVSGATLVPRKGKHQSIHHHASHTSKSFLSQRSSEPQHKISSRVFPSLQGPLPTLEIFQLQPNIVTGTNVCHNSAFLSHPTTHKHQLCLNSQRQVKARHKGELTEEHKYKRC
uniref:Tubulin tyrosine ligase-like family, member 3 n=1 Tax=Maylandia zebra TaxID=106582 RepID=A0A3P9BJ08_9CICH